MSPLSASIDTLQQELDSALQTVLDALAGALSSNATLQQQAVQSVVTPLRNIAQAENNALNFAAESIINGVINELQSASTVSQALLDTVVSQLSAISPNFTAAVAPTSGPTFAAAPAQAPTAPAPLTGPTAQLAPTAPTPTGPTAPLTGPTVLTGTAGSAGAAQFWGGAGWYCYEDDSLPAPVGIVGYLTYLSDLPQGMTIQSGPFAAQALAQQQCGLTQPALPPVTGPTPPLYYVTGPTSPILGPVPPYLSPVTAPTCPPCPTLPTGPTVNVAPAEGERLPKAAGNCWDVTPFTLPNIKINPFTTKRIGDEAWCKAMESVMVTLQTIGKAFVLLADGIVFVDIQLPPTPPDWYISTLGALPLGLGKFFCDFYVINTSLINSLLRVLHNVLSIGLTMIRSITCDDPELTLSLIVIRALLRALDKFRVGTDAGLWATLDIQVKWDQVEAAVEYLIKASCPYIIPTASDAMAACRKGFISTEVYRCWMAMNGHDPDVHNPVFQSNQPAPGTGELQQMLWRLRKDNVAAGAEFTDADYSKGLLQSGMNHDWRQFAFAIRYRVYTLREIRNLLDTGAVQQTEIVDAYRDEGFDATKAGRLAEMERVIYRRRHEAEIQGYTPTRIAYLWGRSVFDELDVEGRMNDLGYSDADAKQLMAAEIHRNKADQARKWALKAETDFAAIVEKQYKEAVITPATAIDALMTMGAQKDAATLIVQAWEEEIKFAYLQSAIAAVKKGWDTGLLSSVQAEQALLNVGVGIAAAQQRVKEWLVNLSVSQNVTTARDTLRFVAEGMISPLEAAARLHNMGWLPADADVLIQESLNKLKATEIRYAASQERQLTQQAKAAAALVKQGEAAKRAGQTALKRLTPVSTLNKWLKEGLIGTDLYTSRMTDMGYPPEEINVYVADISQSKGANVVQTGAVTDLGAPDSGPARADGADH